MDEQYEQTFAMIKPDAFYRGRVADVIDRFEDAGLTVAMAYTTEPDPDRVREHYSDIAADEDELIDQLIDYMAGEPVMPMVLEGRNSVEKARSLAGETQPLGADEGTIRGDLSSYSFDDCDTEAIALPNLVHAADSAAAAQREIELWGDSEHQISYLRPDVDWVRLQGSSYDDLDPATRDRIETDIDLDQDDLSTVYDAIMDGIDR